MKKLLASALFCAFAACGALTMGADSSWSDPLVFNRFEANGSPTTGYTLTIPGATKGTAPNAFHLDPGYVPAIGGDMACPAGNPLACLLKTYNGLPLESALLPHKVNLAALKAYTSYAQPVQRDGFTTPGDGGLAVYSHTTSACSQPDNGAQVAAADGGCWLADLSRGAALRLWGCKGDGIADDSVCVRAAIAAPGVQITDPSGGNYAISCAGGSFPLAAYTTFSGSGRQSTIFTVTSSSCRVFVLPGFYNSMRHLAVQANTTQLAGSVYFVESGVKNTVEDYATTSAYTAFLMTGSVERMLHGSIASPAPGAIQVRAEGGDTSDLIDDLIMGADTNTGPNAPSVGIRVRNSGALVISNTKVLSENNCLVIDPTTATTSGSDTTAGNVFSLTISNSDFDTCSTGVTISPTGTGGVYRTRFADVWTSSAMVNGMSLAGTGAINGLYLENQHALFNAAGTGLAVTNNAASDIQINGGGFGGNAYGMYFGATISGINIHGVSVGQSADATGNTSAAIFLGPSANNIDITGNVMLGNAAPFVDATPGTATKIIANNVGYNPVPRTTGTCSASPCVIGNVTGAPLQILFSNTGGTITAVSEDSVSLPATTQEVLLPQMSNVTITYSGGTTTYSRKGL